MKKLLLLFACVILFAGCGKDNEQTEQTIFLHLKSSDGSLISLNPENTAVYLFEDKGKTVNNTSSNPTRDGHLTYTDGTPSAEPKFVGGGKSVYTFKNVPNGKYILWVHYFPYSIGAHSSKQLTVNESSNGIAESKLFKKYSGYEEW